MLRAFMANSMLFNYYYFMVLIQTNRLNKSLPIPLGHFHYTLQSFNGNLKVIECLLSVGADPYLLDFRGWGPAVVAERAKHGKVAKLIRDHVKKRVTKSTSAIETPLIKHYCKSKITDHSSRSNQSASNLLIDKEDDVPKPEFRSQVDLGQASVDEALVLPGGPWDRDDMYCNKRLTKPNSRDEVFLGQ